MKLHQAEEVESPGPLPLRGPWSRAQTVRGGRGGSVGFGAVNPGRAGWPRLAVCPVWVWPPSLMWV